LLEIRFVNESGQRPHGWDGGWDLEFGHSPICDPDEDELLMMANYDLRRRNLPEICRSEDGRLLIPSVCGQHVTIGEVVSRHGFKCIRGEQL